jgi:hypothetical protein
VSIAASAKLLRASLVVSVHVLASCYSEQSPPKKGS